MAPQPNKRFFKKYLKLLALSSNNTVTKKLIKLAPKQVIKLIANAALLGSRGNIHLTPKQKQLFKTKTNFFSLLGDPSISLDKKEKGINQKGNAIFIPALLSAIIPLVSELLFKGIS